MQSHDERPQRHYPPPLHKEAEFGELYKRYKARFESFAVGYVQVRLIAEDVVTDAFIYYWENRSRLDADCNAAAYILTTIRHKCLNYLRALQVRMRVHNEVGDLQRRVVSENIRSLELCDPQHLFAGEIEKLVRDCMAEMPELTRQVFTARRIHGKSYREIAAECGITERRVETELEKALGKLREVLLITCHWCLPQAFWSAFCDKIKKNVLFSGKPGRRGALLM